MNLDAGEGWKTRRKVDTGYPKLLAHEKHSPESRRGPGLPQQPLKQNIQGGAGIAGPLYSCFVLERSGQTLLAEGGKQQGPTQALYAQAVQGPSRKVVL